MRTSHRLLAAAALLTTIGLAAPATADCGPGYVEVESLTVYLNEPMAGPTGAVTVEVVVNRTGNATRLGVADAYVAVRQTVRGVRMTGGAETDARGVATVTLRRSTAKYSNWRDGATANRETVAGDGCRAGVMEVGSTD